MSNYKISIVTPTHNRKALLLEMLEALAQQSYPMDRLEMIVVIDGDQDGTWEALQSMELPYRLQTLYQPQSGPSAARNRGAIAARGRILLFLDDDLLPQPQLLREHARIHSRDEHAVVLGRFLPSSQPHKKGWQIWEERIFQKHYRAMGDGRRPPAGRRLYSGNFSVKRCHFQAAGGFDERLKRGEDVELGMRLEQAGLNFYFNPHAAAVHRGVRSFESWCQSAYLYGRSDVALAFEKRHPQVLNEIFRWYCRGPALARCLLHLSLDRPLTHRLLRLFARTEAELATALKLHDLAHYGYSLIYKLWYWEGVVDELGGREMFLKQASRWRSLLQTGAFETPTSKEDSKRMLPSQFNHITGGKGG